jgi:dsRNA-specific ribonuclease
MMIINQKKGIEMEKKRIIERMKQLADLIHYEPGDISHLANAMCVNVLNNGNTSNKEYSNGSLATLGDTVLKMIITEKLYLEGKDRGDITINNPSLTLT